MNDSTSNCPWANDGPGEGLEATDLANAEDAFSAAVPPGIPWKPPLPEELSSLIPGYEVLQWLGQGGMGAVYKATQISLDRPVAIKLLPPDLGGDPEFEARFRREAKAMARLNHPHIVQIYDYGHTENGQHYFVMEFVDGSDLHQLVSSGQIDADGALIAVTQICKALQYAHERGFVHRDIKPANILINREGMLKIGDFGLAKLVDREGPQTHSSARMSLTSPGIVMGTPDYAAPEQLEGDGHVDHRADLYSLGIMFYEMLTREIPRGAAWAPSRKMSALDVRIDGVVFKAMDPDPDGRYQTASELQAAVEHIRATSSVFPVAEENDEVSGATDAIAGQTVASSANESPVPRRGRVARLAAGLAAVVVIIAIGGMALWPAGKNGPEVIPEALPGASVPGSAPSTDGLEKEKVLKDYFSQIIRSGITSRKDLEAVEQVRRYGTSFTGISRQHLSWHQAEALARRTGPEILGFDLVANDDPVPLPTWLTDGYRSFLSAFVWIRLRNEPRLLTGVSIQPAGELTVPRRAFLQWNKSVNPPAPPTGQSVASSSAIAPRKPAAILTPSEVPLPPASGARALKEEISKSVLELTTPPAAEAMADADAAFTKVYPWTSPRGQVVQARFIKITDNAVFVLEDNDKLSAISFSNLLQADLEKARKFATDQKRHLEILKRDCFSKWLDTGAVTEKDIGSIGMMQKHVSGFFGLSGTQLTWDQAKTLAWKTRGEVYAFGSPNPAAHQELAAWIPAGFPGIRGAGCWISENNQPRKWDGRGLQTSASTNKSCQVLLHWPTIRKETLDGVHSILTGLAPLHGGMSFSWAKPGVVAEIKGAGELRFAKKPASAYVMEFEVLIRNPRSKVEFLLGEPVSGLSIYLGARNEEDEKQPLVPCRLYRRQPFGFNWWSEKYYEPNRRLSFVLYIADDCAVLEHEGRVALRANSEPTDFDFRIETGDGADATLYRCDWRHLTPDDAVRAGLDFPTRKVAATAAYMGSLVAPQIGVPFKDTPAQGHALLIREYNLGLRWIDPGEFVMGLPTAGHEARGMGWETVKFSRGYWIGMHEITQGQWAMLMKENPSRTIGSPELPLNWVSWSGAASFCEQLTGRERQKGRCPDNYQYRLPTEAEWEYACLSGQKFSDSGSVDNSYLNLRERGSGLPNSLGLYDMLGNTPEWCLDVWKPYLSTQGAVTVDRFHERKSNSPNQVYVVRGLRNWELRDPESIAYGRTRHNDIAGGFRGFRVVLGRKLIR